MSGAGPLHVDPATGLLAGALQVASPNFDARPPGARIDALVVHAISLPPGDCGGDAVERLFCNSLDPAAHPFFREIDGLKVSAHLLVRRDGMVIQFVPFIRRAWHAGVSSLGGRERVNDFSIGIELEGPEWAPFEESQYAALINVARSLRDAYPDITPDRIVGHADIAPGRKTDPGPYFNWTRFRRALA